MKREQELFNAVLRLRQVAGECNIGISEIFLPIGWLTEEDIGKELPDKICGIRIKKEGVS